MSPRSRTLRAVTSKVPGLSLVSFVLNKPLWPMSVPRSHEPSKLGTDYDTDWARRPAARVARRLAIESLTRPFIKSVATPHILGTDRLDHLDGPVIFAANHSSHLDTSLVLTCLPPRFRHRSVVAAGADYFFDKKWKAALWALWINIIPIEREKVGRKSADLAARLIGDGWHLVIFPEGTRSRDGYTGRFRGGAAYLGIRCGVPVVPIHIDGTRPIFGAGARKLRPGSTRVIFGAPIQHDPGEKARQFNERIEKAVAIAADESRTDWWSARRRAAQHSTPSLHGPPELTGWRKSWTAPSPSLSRKRRPWPS